MFQEVWPGRNGKSKSSKPKIKTLFQYNFSKCGRLRSNYKESELTKGLICFIYIYKKLLNIQSAFFQYRSALTNGKWKDVEASPWLWETTQLILKCHFPTLKSNQSRVYGLSCLSVPTLFLSVPTATITFLPGLCISLPPSIPAWSLMLRSFST